MVKIALRLSSWRRIKRFKGIKMGILGGGGGRGVKEVEFTLSRLNDKMGKGQTVNWWELKFKPMEEP